VIDEPNIRRCAECRDIITLGSGGGGGGRPGILACSRPALRTYALCPAAGPIKNASGCVSRDTQTAGKVREGRAQETCELLIDGEVGLTILEYL
jgi:hypothetical protein